jgi:hypothetical protein
VRALCVVEATPLLDDDLRFLQGIEDFSVEEFISEDRKSPAPALIH